MELVGIDKINLGCTIITDETDEQLVSSELADYDVCPKCKSNNIDWGEPDPDGTIIYREHTCLNCETTWEERYDLVQVRINLSA